jgi:hypothetical protein
LLAFSLLVYFSCCCSSLARHPLGCHITSYLRFPISRNPYLYPSNLLQPLTPAQELVKNLPEPALQALEAKCAVTVPLMEFLSPYSPNGLIEIRPTYEIALPPGGPSLLKALNIALTGISQKSKQGPGEVDCPLDWFFKRSRTFSLLLLLFSPLLELIFHSFPSRKVQPSSPYRRGRHRNVRYNNTRTKGNRNQDSKYGTPLRITKEQRAGEPQKEA